MANTVFHDTLIGGYLAVKGLSVINKQSKTITVIKKWQQLWVILGQANTAQWVLAIYHDKSNWMHSQKPLTVYQFTQLHSFTDKQTYDGLHVFLLKFAGGHKISFACGTQKQKSEWLTAVQKALNACYNKKQQKGSRRSVTDDDWWQLSEPQDNTPEFEEFQVVLSSCSLPGNINRCRVCLFPSQSCMEVYGYSTYSSYTARWTWQYSQLYSISFDKETMTLTVQLYISDQLEEICWTGNEVLHLYNVLCNVSGIWDCTAQTSEANANVDDISPTLVRLEESDYTSVGVILPDYLVQQMEDWYLVELVYYQQQPQLLGQYEVQISLTHLHLKGCNSPHCWSWELHHIKTYSLDTDQYLIIEVEGTSDVWSGVFHFGDSGAYNGHITTLYRLLQQLMVKLYLVVMIKQQLIVTRKQLLVLMNNDQSLHSMIECFSCELLEGPSQDLLGHYTLQIFIDQIHVISNNAKWVWLLTELYSYKLDQEEVGGATYVTIQISNSTSAVMEDWVWSGNHMIRFYSFLLELCQLLSRQSCQEILIRQVVTIQLMTSQIVTINTYTIQLTKDDLMLIDADSQQVICSYPLECIKRLDLDEDKNELIVCTSESTALHPSELVIAAGNAQELRLLINKAVQNKQQSLNAQLTTRRSSLGSHQSQLDPQLLSNNYREIARQVSYKQVSTENQESEHQTPTETHADSSQQSAQHHLISAHQIPADNQQVPVNTTHRYPVKTDHTSADTIYKTNWYISHQQPQSVDPTEIKHQITANADNQVTPRLPEAQQQVLTEVHETEYCSSSGFQQIQDNVHQPLHETQLPSHEAVEIKQQVMIKSQEMSEQPHTQIQHTLLKSQQAYPEIPQVPHEGKNTVCLHKTQTVSHLLVEDTTPAEIGEIPQAEVEQVSLKSQQISTEMETPVQPSLEAQLLQVPNQNAHKLPAKLDEAKEVTHEIQHNVTEGEEEQEYTLTERQHVMQQIDDTQVSVGAQVKHNITVNTIQTPSKSQINTQLGSQKIVEEESEHHVAVITQQTPIVSDQATFQTPGEVSNDELMEQTQHIPMETRETVCQYPNTEKTSTDEPRVAQDPTEISNMLSDSRNTILLLETQKVSHLLVEDIIQTKTREIPQAEVQQISQSQQASTPLQPSLEAQLLRLPNQIATEPLVKSDGVKEATREIQHVVTEGEEEQEYTLTESRHVIQLTSAGTPVSVEVHQNTQQVSYLPQLFTTHGQTREMSQAKVQHVSQQVSTEKEHPLLPSLEAQVPNQIAPVNLDEAKDVITEGEEEQGNTLTESQYVMQQIVDTQVLVRAQQSMELMSQVKQSVTVNASQAPNESQLNIQKDNEIKDAEKILNEMEEEESEHHVAVVAQQTPIVSDQATFQTPGEVSNDEQMDQTQYISNTIHQYPNTEETSVKPTVVKTKQEPTEIPQVPNESTNTVLLHKTQTVSHLLVEDTTQTKTGETPQAKVEKISLKTQQVSTEKETPWQPSLEAAQPLQLPNQSAREPPVKSDGAKEVTHEIQHVVTGGKEEQEYTLTECQHVTQLTSADTLVSVEALQNLEPTTSYLPQVKQHLTVDMLRTPHESQMDIQINSDNEQEESKHQFAVIAQQTPIVFNQTTFQTPGEAYDELMEQTQHVSMEIIDTNETSNDKQEPGEIAQVPNESRNTVLLQTQKVSHLLIEDITSTEAKEMPQAEVQLSPNGPQQTLQQTDERSGDISGTETIQQSLNKNIDKLQVTQCTLNENANELIKIHREPADPALDKCAQIMYENTIVKPQNTSPKMKKIFYELKENPQCSTIANTLQLLNDSSQEMTPHLLANTNQIPTDIVCSSSQQQPLLAPNDEDGQQPIMESDKVFCQFMDDNHKVVMTETHHCTTSTDAPTMSCEADITHQSSIPQVTPDNLKEILYQTHEWHSSETQHISDSPPQPVMLTEQTLPNTDQMVTDKRQCVEVDMLCTSEKISNQQFPKTAQELDEPQSVIMHEVVVMDAMPTSVQHVVQHPPSEVCHVSIGSKRMSQETLVETYHESQMKSNNTQESSDETAEQIIHQPVERECVQITNIQESSHDGAKDDTIQSTPDTIYTSVCQPTPMSTFEPQKTALQQPLQQISLEKTQKLQTEALLDEPYVGADQPITLETLQEIPPNSQQVLFTTKATHHENLQTLNATEPSQLSTDVQDQTQMNELQKITYQLPETVEEHQKLIETECTSVKIPETISQIPVGTTLLQMASETVCSQSADAHQEMSLDSHQITTTQLQEVSLGINNDNTTKEAAEVPTKTKESKQCFKFKTSHKTSPFSVEVHELSVKDDYISCQPMDRTQQPALIEPQFQAPQMADKKLCPLSLEAQQSVLHEISIDYREKTVETRKTFYKTSTPDVPYIFEDLFSIETKQPLSYEQLETQESTCQVLDEPQPMLAESEHLEKEQVSVETQLNPLHVSNKILNETQEVVRTVEKPQQIIPPVESITAHEPHLDNMPEAKKCTSPLVVEYDEDVMIIDFTTSDHVTRHSFIIAPSDHVCYHYQLYVDEDVTSTGEEISTCTIRCCSYHILIKIEKVSQKKKFNAAPISIPQYQYDLQSTRKPIDELLLKYL